MLEVHISKHSLFRLKITVGCLKSTYPSIHVETPSRSRSVACGAHIRAFTFLLTKTLARSRSVVWCCVVVCCVVVWCCVVLCGVLWWCVCVVCGEAWQTLSLSLSLSLALSPSFSLSLSFSLLTFFFFYFYFSLAPSLTLALALVLSLSLLPFFPSTHSSLLFSSLPTNTVQSTDQQTRRPTLRRLNVIWRRASAQQSVLSLLLSPPFSPSPPQKKRGNFLLQEFFRRGNYLKLQF